MQEYIKKYNLEDELSHAVNLAIKENSDDPFKVISEYTKGLSKGAGDEDEDEDEDEVVTEEQEMKMPVLKGRKRHEQVRAPPPPPGGARTRGPARGACAP